MMLRDEVYDLNEILRLSKKLELDDNTPFRFYVTCADYVIEMLNMDMKITETYDECFRKYDLLTIEGVEGYFTAEEVYERIVENYKKELMKNENI